MSRVKVYLLVVLMAFIMAALSSCGDDDDGDSGPMNPTLVEAAQTAGLTTLLDAVTAADLGNTLLNADAITVFAPTNEAFGDLLEDEGVQTLDQLVARIGGVGNLQEVLGFHVVPAVAFANDLAEGEQTFNTLTDPVQQITVTRTGGNVTVTDAAGNTYQVTQADVAIENGVVHVINGVLLPNLTVPTVTTAVAADPNLSSLETAIGLVDGLGAALDGLESFTVFAPTDAAFTSLVQNSGAADLTELVGILGDDLATVLNFHVIDVDAFFSDELEATQDVTTLAGEELTIARSGNDVTVTDSQGNTFNVTMADIAVAEDGVVHIIDGVVLPPLPIATTARLNPNLSVLEEALLKFPNLVTELSGTTTDYTVFAPTNDAFVALLGLIGQNELDDIPEDVLLRVLQYHVVAGTELSTDLDNNESLNTLLTDEGETSPEQLTVSTTNGVQINGINVTGPDVSVTNGVVHVVEGVLVPELELSIVNTVVEPAYFNVNFTTLAGAVLNAGLLGTLTDTEADLTLFAPDNTAFEGLIADLDNVDNVMQLLDLGEAALSDILTYHVIDPAQFMEAVFAEDLPTTGTEGQPFAATIPTINGDFYLTNRGSGVFINGSTEVVAATSEGGALDYNNGVVHLIDQVLRPVTGDDIVAVAIAEGYSELAAALTEADLVSTLQGAGPFTVFAPTNQAFTDLYAFLGVDDATQVPDATLTAVLTYHVINGARVFSSDLTDGLEATTFEANNTTITINVGDGVSITDRDDDLPDANVDLDGVNILTSNGVIHVIDAVLLPVDVDP